MILHRGKGGGGGTEAAKVHCFIKIVDDLFSVVALKTWENSVTLLNKATLCPNKASFSSFDYWGHAPAPPGYTPCDLGHQPVPQTVRASYTTRAYSQGWGMDGMATT